MILFIADNKVAFLQIWLYWKSEYVCERGLNHNKYGTRWVNLHHFDSPHVPQPTQPVDLFLIENAWDQPDLTFRFPGLCNMYFLTHISCSFLLLILHSLMSIIIHIPLLHNQPDLIISLPYIFAEYQHLVQTRSETVSIGYIEGCQVQAEILASRLTKREVQCLYRIPRKCWGKKVWVTVIFLIWPGSASASVSSAIIQYRFPYP